MAILSGYYEVKGLRRLDPQVIGALYDCYYPDVYRFVHYRLDDETVVEDISSEAFIYLIKAIKSGQDPQTRLKAWLFRIVSYLIVKHIQESAHRVPKELPDHHLAAHAHKELVRSWQSLISMLTEEQQNILALRLGGGYSIEETAGLMKRNVDTIKQLQFEALLALDQRGSHTQVVDHKSYDTLEICLQALEQGADIKICMMRFPMYADELRPILEMAVRARAAAVRHVSLDAMQHGRAQVLRRAAEMREQERGSAAMILPFWLKPEFWGQSLRLTFTSAATVAVLATGGTGLMYKSSGLLPDATKYPAKEGRVVKDVALSLYRVGPIRSYVPAMTALEEIDQTVDDSEIGTSPKVPTKPHHKKPPETKLPKTPGAPKHHKPNQCPGSDDEHNDKDHDGPHAHRKH